MTVEFMEYFENRGVRLVDYFEKHGVRLVDYFEKHGVRFENDDYITKRSLCVGRYVCV